MKVAKPNAGVRLLFDILYEKYKSKISYTPTTINNLSNHNHRLDEEENENGINQDDDLKTERALSQENLMLQISKKKGHQKSRSDVSGIYFFQEIFVFFFSLSKYINYRNCNVSL